MMQKNYADIITDVILLVALQVFMFVYFDIRYLFYDTIITGGDTASWHGVANHMLETLLPSGRLSGWDMGNFCGYPNFNFYFIIPFFLAVFPAFIFNLPLTITLKLAIASGLFLLPVTTYFGLRSMKYRFPVPVIGASAALVFLFNESYTMFGGNTLSTFAGEFYYMFAFAIFVFFIGSLYKGITTDRNAVKNGLILGVIGLSHLFVFIPAGILLLYWFFARENVTYLLKLSIVAFGLMAFWILPLIAFRYPYTTYVYMIWQDFVNLPYTFAGLGIICLFIGPMLTLCAVGKNRDTASSCRGLKVAMLCFAGIGSFIITYLSIAYILFGNSMWHTGLKTADLSTYFHGFNTVFVLNPASVILLLISFAVAITVTWVGLRSARQPSGYKKFCLTTGGVSFLIALIFFFTGFYLLVSKSITDDILRSVFLKRSAIIMASGITAIIFGRVIFFSGRFTTFILLIAANTVSDRFKMYLGLIFGCLVAYFSAHFLNVPDIRFLPPLLFALVLIFFADTLDPVFSISRQKIKIAAAVIVCYLCVLTVIFGAEKSEEWFKYNNMGYEYKTGYQEFACVNKYLKTVYQKDYSDPLNAPRVGYEKCDMYEKYGGDRVFESLPFFSGRQTMEGIHYASSIASRFIAFFQSEYSRDIKTPCLHILSRMNPKVLPVHCDLYNISQLILMTGDAKNAIAASPVFEKEAEFGDLSIYRYTGCNERYVDVPEIRPVLYTGKNWVKNFYRWYKCPQQNDILFVPKDYVKDKEDLAVFFDETDNVISNAKELAFFRNKRLDRAELKIETHLSHLKISFTTTKLDVPHLIKISYFPNWKVRGAHGIYPVSPHLMMVIPRENKIVITYEKTFWEKSGAGITIATLLVIFLIWFSRLMTKLFPRVCFENIRMWFCAVRSMCEKFIRQPASTVLIMAKPYLLILIILVSVLLIAGGAVYRNRPVRAYIKSCRDYKVGNELLKTGKPDAAAIYLKKAVNDIKSAINRQPDFDHRDIVHGLLFSAMSYEKLGLRNKAEILYWKILKKYPYSRYTGEAFVKIARIQKHDRNRIIEKGLTELRLGDRTSGLLLLKKGIQQTVDGLRYFNLAVRRDPYSAWASYACDDIKKEKEFFQKKKEEIFSLCYDKDVRKAIGWIISIIPEAKIYQG